MRFEFFIARRYLKAKRATIFQSIIILISMAGVFIGVTTILIVLSVMSGFQKDLQDKILGTNAHIAVLKYFNEPVTSYDSVLAIVKEVPHVVGAVPFIYTKVMINNDNYVDGIVLRGVDEKNLSEVSDIETKLVYGTFNFSKGDIPGIVLGSILADNLRVHTGDELSIFSTANFTATPMGYIPKFKRFRVIGIFEAGMFEYDAALAYVSLQSAQKLIGMNDAVTGIEVKIDKIYKAPEISREIEKRLGFPFRANHWIRMNRSLFAALKLEKTVMFIILVLIIVVASFNIVATLILIVIQKTKDIGILKSMGASSRQIMRIFMFQGLMIGTIGTALGIIAGVTVSFLLGKYRFISLPSDVYFIDTLPVHMVADDFIIVGVAAIIVSFLATIYPAMRAAKLDPVRAIRYE
ncbi:MAG: lipoprotein-releasing ABC transporter permease subunit [Candidatus Cloacimonadota bacterium]|nr:MAG: lipoprotein-releasing ABC transporter permease subunit [Candidatus Cloacimonadota bacterium]